MPFVNTIKSCYFLDDFVGLRHCNLPTIATFSSSFCAQNHSIPEGERQLPNTRISLAVWFEGISKSWRVLEQRSPWFFWILWGFIIWIQSVKGQKSRLTCWWYLSHLRLPPSSVTASMAVSTSLISHCWEVPLDDFHCLLESWVIRRVTSLIITWVWHFFENNLFWLWEDDDKSRALETCPKVLEKQFLLFFHLLGVCPSLTMVLRPLKSYVLASAWLLGKNLGQLLRMLSFLRNLNGCALRFGVLVRAAPKDVWITHGLGRFLADSSLLQSWPSGVAHAESWLKIDSAVQNLYDLLGRSKIIISMLSKSFNSLVCFCATSCSGTSLQEVSARLYEESGSTIQIGEIVINFRSILVDFTTVFNWNHHSFIPI